MTAVLMLALLLAPAPAARGAESPRFSVVHSVISPTGGDTVYKSATVTLTDPRLKGETALVIDLIDGRGEVLRTVPMHNNADADPATYGADIDALDGKGQPLPDGQYQLRVRGPGYVYDGGFLRVDSQPPRVLSATATPVRFVTETVIEVAFSEYTNWAVALRGPNGAAVRGWAGSGTSARFVWNGRHDNGSLIEGEYRLHYVARDAAGHQIEGYGPTIVRRASVGLRAVSIDRKVIAPGRGIAGTATISGSVDETVTYRLEVRSPAGELVRSIGGGADAATPLHVTFDGTDARGQALPSGIYTYVLRVEDDLGNFSLMNGTIEIDIDPPHVVMGEPPVVTVRPMLQLPYAASDRSGVSVTVDRAIDGRVTRLTVDPGASELAIPLAEGTQVILITAADPVGNRTVREFSVTRVSGREVRVFVGNKPLVSDVPAEIVGGRTMLPLRAVSEAIGLAVGWEEATRTITLTGGGRSVQMQIGSQVALVDGRPASLDAAPYIKDGRTMVPVRFISESLGREVIWNAEAQSVLIR